MSSAALATRAPVIVPSDILGNLTVAEEEIVRFRSGLVGLPECRSFVLLRTERPDSFWLQSVEHSALAFLLVDPFVFFEGYSVEVGPAEMAEIGASEESEIVLLSIVTLPATRGGDPTANLQGPLAINLDSRRGKQMVVESEEFGVRHAFKLT